MEQPNQPATRSWRKFTLSEMFLWTTYAGIAAALSRWHVVFALLFLVWVAPAVSRFRATLFVDEVRAFNMRHGHTPAFLGLAVHCLATEFGFMMVAWFLTVLASIPLLVINQGVIYVASELGVYISPAEGAQVLFVMLVMMAAMYAALLFWLNYITWPPLRKK